MKRAILFKSLSDQEGPDKFQTFFQTSTESSRGWTLDLIPVITFAYSNLRELKQELVDSPNKYDGLILTSPRCVSSIEEALKPTSSSPKDLLDPTKQFVFCVGPTTLKAAQKVFGTSANFIVGDKEDSEHLGRKIVEVLPPNSGKLLLYPCGNLRGDTILDILSNHGIGTKTLVTYETIENPELPKLIEGLKGTLKGTEPFIFFSPSGVRAFLKYGGDLVGEEEQGGFTKGSRPLIGIGPTTGKALDELRGGVVYQCETPTPQGLLNCLNKL